MEQRIREHYIRKYSLIAAIISFIAMISSIAGECIYNSTTNVEFNTSAELYSELSEVHSVEPSITSEEISTLVDAILTLDNDVNKLTEALETTTELARIELEEPEEIYSEVETLNIHEGVGDDTDIITSIEYGTKMIATAYIITEEEEEWAEISTSDGTPQFVNASYTTTDNPNVKYMGDFYITYYCPCAQCCGTANNPTASGVMPKANHTIAADPSIAFGTKLVINGTEYTVEDRGGAIKGNHIDIFCATHQEALNHKTETVPVYKILDSEEKSYF
jgi:3D (Asp-Asp-Asp) domain-containing protein